MSAPVVEVQTWRVSAADSHLLNEMNRSLFSVEVQNGGSEYGWGIRRMGQCLGKDGTWDYEPQPSSRTKKWLKSHRFPQDEAIERAKAVVDSLTVNGRTLAEVIAWEATQ